MFFLFTQYIEYTSLSQLSLRNSNAYPDPSAYKYCTTTNNLLTWDILEPDTNCKADAASFSDTLILFNKLKDLRRPITRRYILSAFKYIKYIKNKYKKCLSLTFIQGLLLISKLERAGQCLRKTVSSSRKLVNWFQLKFNISRFTIPYKHIVNCK